MFRKLFGAGGLLGIFSEYPVLLRLGMVSVCVETAWATLFLVMEYHFKDDLLAGQGTQLIASRIAIAMLAFMVCEAAFKVPMGKLSDRIGARKVIVSALLFALLSPVLMAFAGRWWAFVPLRMLDGLAAAAVWPSMSALMARAVPRKAKAAAMSVFNGAYTLGMAIGPLSGLYLGNIIGNRWVFPIAALLLALGAGVAWIVLNNDLGEVPVSHQSQSKAREPLLRGRPMLKRMMVIYACSQMAIGILAMILPLYIDSAFGIGQAEIPRLIIIPAIILAAIALPIGRFADVIGRPLAVWLSYLSAVIGMILVAVFQIDWVFGIGALFLANSFILGTPAWLGLTSLQVENHRQAEALSFMQMAQGVGVIMGLGSVAVAGHLLTQWDKIDKTLMSRGVHIAPQLQSVNAISLDVWLHVCVGLFVFCLIAALLWVREPEAETA